MIKRNWKKIFLAAVVVLATIVGLAQYRKANALQDRLGCVATWLEQAKTLHTIQMKEPANFTGDTMQKLMDSVDWAYDCATKEPSHSRIAPGGGSFGQHGVQPHR
jgi:hypothetical protein